MYFSGQGPLKRSHSEKDFDLKDCNKGDMMKTVKEITLNLERLFAKLLEMDKHCEELQRQTNENGGSQVEEYGLLDKTSDNQRQTKAESDNSSREYWNAR